MCLTIYLVLTLSLIVYLYFKNTFNYWKSRGFPHLQPKFPFGNFTKYISLQSSLGDTLSEIYNSSTEPYVGFWAFGSPCLLIRSPEIIKHVLAQDFNYFTDRTLAANEEVDPISSNFLLLLKNPKWKSERQNVTHFFTTAKLKTMVYLMDKSAADTVKYMKEKGKVLEVRELGSKYTIEVIASCIFGINAEAFGNETSKLIELGKRLLEPNLVNGLRIRSYYFAPFLVNLFKIKFFNPEATTFLQNIIFNTISHRQKTGHNKNDIIDFFVKYIEECKQSGTAINKTEIISSAIQMYSAGFETTSATISFALYLLSTHKDIQDKAREEVNAVFAKNQCLDYECAKHLKYLDNIIAETLRMFPPLDFLDRRCMADYKLPNSDLVIEKGTSIYIATTGLHYDPNFYLKPTEFNPDRFSEGNCENFAYLPFGEGPRNCIGKIFGKLITKICLAYIIKEFEIETSEETQKELKMAPTSFILHADGGIKLRFEELQK